MKRLQKRGHAKKGEGKGRRGRREYDGRTALREFWKEWEDNGETLQ